MSARGRSDGVRRRAVLLSAFLLAGWVTVLVPGTASACSCANVTFADRAARAQVIFTGTPTASQLPPVVDGMVVSDAAVRWTFAVHTVLRDPAAPPGPVGPATDVWSPFTEASCGLTFRPGRPYLVLGRMQDDRVTAELCGGSTPLSAVDADDLAALGPGRAATAVPIPDGSLTTDPTSMPAPDPPTVGTSSSRIDPPPGPDGSPDTLDRQTGERTDAAGSADPDAPEVGVPVAVGAAVLLAGVAAVAVRRRRAGRHRDADSAP